MLNFNFSQKGLELVPSTHFVYDFSKKMFHVIFYYLTKFYCLIDFSSWNIGQYVYYNCLLTSLWRHTFETNFIFLIKPFCFMTKKPRQKLQYFEDEKSFSGEIKKHFIVFKALLVVKNCLRPESASLIRITVHKYRYWILKITLFPAGIGCLVKLLSNHKAILSPENLENINNYEGWGLPPVAHRRLV